MKTLLTMFCILCTTCFLRAQTISQAEYFIDDDKGVGRNTELNLAGTNDSSYQINIDVSGVSAGFHKLYIRVKDTKRKWSTTLERTIQVINSFDQPQIITGEYFFDKDLGYGRGQKIVISKPDTAIEKTFAALTAALSVGHHKLYMRFKNDDDEWGITQHRDIEIIKTEDTVKIIAAEYFFSGDKGIGKDKNKVFTEALEDGKFRFRIPYNRIPADADTIFIRTEDSLGNWSLTKLASFSVASFANNMIGSEQNNALVDNDAKTFAVFPNPATQNINIKFSSKNANATLQIFDMNGKLVLQKTIPGSIVSTIDISKLVAGSYTIMVNDGETQRSEKFIKE